MPDLIAIQRLICEMYLHTSHGATTRQHANATASAERVRRAPCQKKAPTEISRGFVQVQGAIIDDLLNGPVPVEIVREQLQRWEGVKVR